MNFYNRRYELDVDKANWMQKEAKEAILDKLEFNELDPNRKNYLRPRMSVEEIQPNLRY